MSKRGKPKLVVSEDGQRLFVHVRDSGIHPLVVYCDGLRLAYFGKQGPYLDVEAVANWHEKELRESNGKSGIPLAVTAFRNALAQFQAGNVIIEDEPPRPRKAKKTR